MEIEVIHTSQSYIEFMNLHNLAHIHKKNCVSDKCGVSLFHLKKTAERLQIDIINNGTNDEYASSILILKDWPL